MDTTTNVSSYGIQNFKKFDINSNMSTIGAKVPPTPKVEEKKKGLPTWLWVLIALIILLVLGVGFVMFRKPATNSQPLKNNA